METYLFTKTQPIDLTEWEEKRILRFINERFESAHINANGHECEQLDFSDGSKMYYVAIPESTFQKRDRYISRLVHILINDFAKEPMAICFQSKATNSCTNYPFDKKEWVGNTIIQEDKRQVYFYDESCGYTGVVTAHQGKVSLGLNSNPTFDIQAHLNITEFFNREILDTDIVTVAHNFKEKNDDSKINDSLKHLGQGHLFAYSSLIDAFAENSVGARKFVESMLGTEDFKAASANLRALRFLNKIGITGDKLSTLTRLCNEDTSLVRIVSQNLEYNQLDENRFNRYLDHEVSFDRDEFVPDYMIDSLQITHIDKCRDWANARKKAVEANPNYNAGKTHQRKHITSITQAVLNHQVKENTPALKTTL